MQANDLAVVALLGNVGAGEPEAQHAAADNLVADAAVWADAAGIGHHALRLAGHVGARVPGVGQPMQRERRAVGHVSGPAVLRRFGGLDCREAGLAHRNQSVDHPIDVLLDRYSHVRQHRRAARAGDHEQVGKAGDGKTEIGLRAVGPDVGQRFSATAGDRMNGHDGSGHGVEAGGEHDDIHVERALVGLNAGGRDRLDRLLPQVHQRDVGTVVRGVVVGIETGRLAPNGWSWGLSAAAVSGSFTVVADFLADQLGEQRVAVDVDALVGPELGQYVDEIAGGPRLSRSARGARHR